MAICFFCFSLALLLLVLRILADYHHVAFSLDDFALFANLLDGRLNFHCFIPFLSEIFYFFLQVMRPLVRS
jgi:hypothetical protein